MLEFSKPDYTPRLDESGLVERIDILDLSPANPRATLIADLADAPQLPSEMFHCVICTQTLHLIYDVRAAIQTLHRILKPGGTLLASVPGISQICRPDIELHGGDYWRFTTRSVQRLFDEVFDSDALIIEPYGNVLSASAFLYGLATQDMTPSDLDVEDPDYQLVIGIQATKRGVPVPPDGAKQLS